MKVGDLVRKHCGSYVRDTAGLGLVIAAHAGCPSGNPGPSYKVQWSKDYGTFWASEDKLERVSENRR